TWQKVQPSPSPVNPAKPNPPLDCRTGSPALHQPAAPSLITENKSPKGHKSQRMPGSPPAAGRRPSPDNMPSSPQTPPRSAGGVKGDEVPSVPMSHMSDATQNKPRISTRGSPRPEPHLSGSPSPLVAYVAGENTEYLKLHKGGEGNELRRRDKNNADSLTAKECVLPSEP
ncbi:hypothetical protein CYMTET_13986, partial [Cymbomonas tetramitiformis]